ncbi:hypothetical protein L3Q82_003989 [Scortum barcoo]|uniref:Uncharacterized protein n=1 Tax=Scortum barcoo TaxID=214431 RepID=A0ACB8X6W6_9TELE|nr:hypothetical protein L3Q82_003989 [Scortum barcoo]
MGSEIRDCFSLLNVLYANQFEGESFKPELLEQTEINFYRGAPPEWLNFHISDQAESDGTGTPFIKRDGYDTLVEQILQKRKRPGTSAIKLFHQPGCGGTTLAMKVLWDLRKNFRCAVLTGSTSDTNIIKNIAKEVVDLFTAGSRGNQNTVLLLLNDEQILENLQDSIRMELAKQNIVAHIPVVILLSCVRIDRVLQSDHVVLQEKLSDSEKQKFNEKKEELSRRYREKCKKFHGFNIMQTDFSPDYVKQACTIFSIVRKKNKPRKTQLAAFLSLLNAYVPGSYLLEYQCLDFFKHEDYMHGGLSLEDRMKPFNDLIVIFQQDKRFEKKVCMAHPMIAQHCIELMDQGRVSRSDTARNFLTCFCGDEVPPFLLGFVKDMLTSRKPKPKETGKDDNPTDSTEIIGDTERFSRLILDIQKMEGEAYSASVLKVATKTFAQNPFFPQALARFCYIELKDYNQAEMWAKGAKERDPQNSFVADTLGQVHKNHLKSIKHSAKSRDILQLAQKAIEAFKHEEQLAENEKDTDMKEDGMTKVSHVFNNRGMFGYLQVCNLVYDLLVRQNETWRDVLTKCVSMDSVLESLGDNKVFRFNGLINSLRDEVRKKCAFFDKYLTYSKPEGKKDDPSYIFRDTSDCYRKYVRRLITKPSRTKRF